jgi:hypothetical protein
VRRSNGWASSEAKWYHANNAAKGRPTVRARSTTCATKPRSWRSSSREGVRPRRNAKLPAKRASSSGCASGAYPHAPAKATARAKQASSSATPKRKRASSTGSSAWASTGGEAERVVVVVERRLFLDTGPAE